jgi:hypothetical protein
MPNQRAMRHHREALQIADYTAFGRSAAYGARTEAATVLPSAMYSPLSACYEILAATGSK